MWDECSGLYATRLPNAQRPASHGTSPPAARNQSAPAARNQSPPLRGTIPPSPTQSAIFVHMTRRQFALAAAAAPATSAAPTTPPAIAYRNYARCWPDWMRRLAQDAYLRRKAALARLTTPASIAQRQAWARATLWQLIGGEPARTPLHVTTHGALDRPGYRLEKLTYESQPGLVVAANLYIPRHHRPPFPGVLFQMGHALNGKANEGYQRCCQGLAQLGYLVLAFDPMGQGERTYYPQPNGGTLTRLGSADDEHTLPGQQMLLVGDTATRLQLWDAIRSLDVLAAHPKVDPTRLASTGQSGGATLTMLLAAADSRLAAAALTCGNTENFACRDFNPPGSTDDAEQNFVNAAPHGFDRWDLIYPLAPKPLLIAASARDFFGTYSVNYLSSGREEFAELQRVYGLLGRTPSLRWFETPLPHGLTPPMRLEIYQWFETHLQNKTKPLAAEPPTEPEPDETLWTGRTGNTVRDHNSLRPIDLIRARLAASEAFSGFLQPPGASAGTGLSPSPTRNEPAASSETRTNEPKLPSSGTGFSPSPNPASQTNPDWPRLLSLRAIPATKPTILSRTRFGDVEIEAIEVASEAPIFLPAWLYKPKTPNGKLLLIADPAGRSARWQEGQLLHQLAQGGFTVCAADLRGIGDLRPEPARGAAPYSQSHQQEDHWAWASLMLGRPMLGQRVVDLLALVHALAGLELHLISSGRLNAAALLATHLEPNIAALHYLGSIPSLEGIATSEEYSHPFADFVPRILLHTDLPALASSRRYRRFTRWEFSQLKDSVTPR